MTRTLVALAAVTAFAAPAYAAPDLPVQSPVKVVEDTRACPAGYSQIGYVGPPGARWKVCTGSPIKQ
jgi:hypothetical protein